MSDIEYIQSGDYLIPNIILSESTRDNLPALGRYGRMRRSFLKEHCPIQYNRLLLTEQLFPHLREVDATANLRRENGVSEGVIVKEHVCEI
jgi:hypothetical protein